MACVGSCRTQWVSESELLPGQKAGGTQCSGDKKSSGYTFPKLVAAAVAGVKSGPCGCEVGTRSTQDRAHRERKRVQPGGEGEATHPLSGMRLKV